jgi:hypothetical protein
MFFLGIFLILISAVFIFFPLALWPLQQFSNEVRGIKGTKPTDAFRIVTGLQGAFIFTVGLTICIVSYSDFAKANQERFLNDQFQSIKFTNNNGTLTIENTNDKNVELKLADCTEHSTIDNNFTPTMANINVNVEPKKPTTVKPIILQPQIGYCIGKDGRYADCSKVFSTITCKNASIKIGEQTYEKANISYYLD